MQDFRNLKVWQRAHGLTLDVYRATRAFPVEERLGLLSQTRRAAASIPTNIAEGGGRGSNADFRRFLLIANGSACELDYLLLLAADLGYIPPTTTPALQTTVAEVKRILTALIRSLSSS